MTIDWGAFGEVFVVSFGAAVGIIVLFAIGVALLARTTPAPDRTVTDAGTAAAQATPTAANRAIAYLCFAACALGVAYGLYIIISK